MTDFPILYSRTAKGAVNTWRIWTDGPAIICEWGAMGGKMQTSTVFADPKNTGKANATTAEEQAVKEAEAKHTAQIKKKYSPNLETAGETKRVKPMLAEGYEKHKKKLKFPVTLQPKLDGVRCLAYWLDGNIVLQSRGGDFYRMEHVIAALKDVLSEGMTLDGELYNHDISLQDLNSLVRRPQAGSEAVQYHVYDVPSHGGTWIERQEFLGGLGEDGNIVQVVDSPLADSHEHILEIYRDLVEAGYEGAIVRAHDGLYRFGSRSAQLLKVKSFLDREYVITGWCEGKDGLPVFTCITDEGKTFDVRPTGTREQRLDMLKNANSLIGQLMKTKYFDLTDDGIPHFPVGLGIRDPGDLS